MSPSEWVPIRWSSGPLDIAARKEVTSDEKHALQAWHQPAALRVLKDSPFNCIVVSLAAGVAEDAAQRRSLKPLVDAAKSKNLAVLGRVTGKAQAGDAARELGLDGVLSDTGMAGGPALVPEPDWPSVRLGRGGNAESGPTGYPWVDANGWKIQLARTLDPGRTVWSTAEPKRTGAPVRADQYAVAVADAAAYGGRWVVSLDPITQGGLLEDAAESRESWTTITRSVKFFEAHKDWATLNPMARIGVVSDFSGPNEFLSHEYLNLSARRQLPYRIVPSDKINPNTTHGLRALVIIGDNVDRQALVQYIMNGGMVILPPGKLADASKAHPSAGRHETGYEMYKADKGVIAVSPEEWSDPYQVAQDAHRLIGRKNDVVRLFNAGSAITYPTGAAKRSVVHITNYTGRPSPSLMSLYLARPHTEARFHDLSGKVETLKVERKNEGAEVALPVFTSYAAVEFGDKA